MKRFTLTLSCCMAAAMVTGMADAAPNDDTKEKITFTKDVLPILQENCQICHRENGANLGGMIAPMSFTSYRDVRPWAKAIAKSVKARVMPPWDATEHYNGVFRNERVLTQEEIATIVHWVENGTLRGDLADAPDPPDFLNKSGWQIGEPDLIVSMPERYFVNDDVEDIYVNFETPVTAAMLPEDRYIKGIEFRPGSSVVHHIISNELGGLAPGNEATIYRDGYSTLMRAGSSVSWQMHYHKEPGPGTGIYDQSSVGITFHPVGYEPEHPVRMEMLANMNFSIPAGDPDYAAVADYVFERDVEILSMTPHMHLRGKSAYYSVHYPDGTSEKILDVPNYDFNWQTSYKYAELKTLPAGSRIHLEMHWDNSAENPYNPDPTKDVVFGEPTTAEMMFGFVNFAFVDEPEAINVSAKTLDAFAGTYVIAGGPTFIVTSTGSVLTLEVVGQGKFPLETVSNTEFELSLASLKIKFETNDEGGIEIHGEQGGGKDRKSVV